MRRLPVFEALCNYAKDLELDVELFDVGSGSLALVVSDGAGGVTDEFCDGVEVLDDAAGLVLARLRREQLA